MTTLGSVSLDGHPRACGTDEIPHPHHAATGTADMSNIVSLKHVAKRYTRGKQAVEVLHSLNLEITQGDFVALMGPSGSGKTTLLNLIGGLDRPSEGEVAVAGDRIDQLSGEIGRASCREGVWQYV